MVSSCLPLQGGAFQSYIHVGLFDPIKLYLWDQREPTCVGFMWI